MANECPQLTSPRSDKARIRREPMQNHQDPSAAQMPNLEQLSCLQLPSVNAAVHHSRRLEARCRELARAAEDGTREFVELLAAAKDCERFPTEVLIEDEHGAVRHAGREDSIAMAPSAGLDLPRYAIRS